MFPVYAVLLACTPRAPEPSDPVGPGTEVVDTDTDLEPDVPTAGSAGCGTASTLYTAGTTTGSLEHGGLTRTFRVRLPPGYDASQPHPVVLLFHGGGGSGRQLEENSARFDPIADREGAIAIYPDGTGLLKTWNGEGCCGAAVREDVDDVGFVAALLDHLEAEVCVDPRRVFATGMSNGGIFSHRLGCELSERIAAIGPVAGVAMTSTCTPSRPVPMLHIHGSEDAHVPWEGGEGCGPAGVPFPAVSTSMEGWRTRNTCGSSTTATTTEGDGHCDAYDGCAADTVLCTIEGGGHSWPGGEPSADVADCPADGFQSTTFDASEALWTFFAAHPRED